METSAGGEEAGERTQEQSGRGGELVCVYWARLQGNLLRWACESRLNNTSEVRESGERYEIQRSTKKILNSFWQFQHTYSISLIFA